MSATGHPKNTWKVEIDSQACTLCEVCVHRCSTHALLLRRTESGMEILFDHQICDGCMGQTLCRESCPESAVTVGRVPATELPDEPISLVVGEMSTCQGCGNRFMPVRKLTALLEHKKITAKPIQTYCPSCRRERLLHGYMNLTGQV